MSKFFPFFLLVFAPLFLCGQTDCFSYLRPLSPPTEDWHTVELPDEIFGKIKSDFSDLRIYPTAAVSEGKPMSDVGREVPYILKAQTDKIERETVNFEVINTTHNATGWYYTFILPAEATLNRIELEFRRKNFAWQATLEGSQNQAEWFTVVRDYRLVGIADAQTFYQFTDLVFPPARYKYWRLSVKSDGDPELLRQTFSRRDTVAGEYRNHNFTTVKTEENKEKKTTEIIADLGQSVPVSRLDFDIADKTDYYRRAEVRYLSDSILVNNVWKYNFRPLTSDVLSSLEKSRIELNKTVITNRLKIIIRNDDNAPLSLKKVTAAGPVYRLIARFAGEGDYALYYGNNDARKPVYDIDRFVAKIPQNLSALELGSERDTGHPDVTVEKPLFENRLWLWAVLLVIMVLLGGFALKMMRE